MALSSGLSGAANASLIFSRTVNRQVAGGRNDDADEQREAHLLKDMTPAVEAGNPVDDRSQIGERSAVVR